ncbi:IS3 family transposase [Rhodococcus oxybenzonivorans]|uniref:IS3 family transposase n=1 Tax=Rhodococcus oxybenzonivorans TaxID=1990687 RepID=UPI000D690474|nr:IS3 family transposase [Rhodococcus oxybenzonivorans]
MPNVYPAEVREKAVRLVLEHRDEYASEYEAIRTIAERMSLKTETVRVWVRKAEAAGGGTPAASASEAEAELRALRRKNAELEKTIEILKAATFFLRAGVRPATQVICRFIAEHRDQFGVVPICRVLTEHGCTIAPRTFYAWRSRPLSKRALWDATITAVLASYYVERDEHGRRRPESLYGSLKMWAHLRRQGIEVARCTVERLMRVNGWRGASRAKRVRTTVPEPSAPRPPDLVDRNFRVDRPDALYVADFTYVRMVSGFAYTAFVIDAFAGTIVGWEVSTSKETAFVQRAVNQACTLRTMQGNPLRGNTIHHSDAGSQYTALRFGETLFLQGLLPSIGSVADAFDNALAETTVGLYKAECIADDSPFRIGPLRTVSDVEEATSAWVHWYNTDRLMHRLGRIPPTEYEARYYAAERADQPVAHK